MLEEDGIGLKFEAIISKTSWGKDFYALIKDGIIKGVSFGMRVNEDYWNYTEEGISLRTITDIDLFEISVLKNPAYSQTLVEARDFEMAEIKVPKNKQQKEIRELIEENEEFEEFEEITITPQQILDGLNLIAEKVDNVMFKLQELETKKDSEELAEAKQVLEETKNVVDASKKVALEQAAEVAGDTDLEERAEPIIQPDDLLERQEIANRDNKQDGDPIQPKMPEDNKEELEEKEKEKQEDPLLEVDVDKKEEVEEVEETEVDSETKEEETKETEKETSEEDSEEVEKVDEKETEQEKEVDEKVIETRSLLEKFKMEVPEIG